MWKYILIHTVNHFICDSNDILQKLRQIGRALSHIDPILFMPPPKRTLKELSPLDPVLFERLKRLRDSHKLILVYFGRISTEKGIDHLWEAIQIVERKYPGVCGWIIAGEIGTSGTFSGDFAREITEKCSADVVLAGFVHNIPSLLEWGNVHIAPSVLEEAYGLVVVEAKKAGRPSIIFSTGGMRELVQNNITGKVCEEKTATAIVAAVEYYLTRPEMTKIHGQSAKDSLESLGITYEHFRRSLLKIYE